jgi:hypothetical protein
MEQRIVASLWQSGVGSQAHRGTAGVVPTGAPVRTGRLDRQRQRWLATALNTRVRRLALVAGLRRAVRSAAPARAEPHMDTNYPGEVVGTKCFFGRLRGSSRPVWHVQVHVRARVT